MSQAEGAYKNALMMNRILKNLIDLRKEVLAREESLHPLTESEKEVVSSSIEALEQKKEELCKIIKMFRSSHTPC